MSRTLIPVGECGLLSRRNARRYCGGLGEERFDRVVGRHVTPRLIGGERFYVRKELDDWIVGPVQSDSDAAWEIIEQRFAADRAHVAETERLVLDALREAKRPCTAQDLTKKVMAARDIGTVSMQAAREEERCVRGRLRRLLERRLVRRMDATGKGHVAWEIAAGPAA